MLIFWSLVVQAGPESPFFGFFFFFFGPKLLVLRPNLAIYQPMELLRDRILAIILFGFQRQYFFELVFYESVLPGSSPRFNFYDFCIFFNIFPLVSKLG